MNEILPIFKSHYSIGKSILTLRNSESTPDEADSIFDICAENKLKEATVVDDSMSGFLEAYKNSKELELKLIFGLRITICNEMSQKDSDSLKTNSKILIFMKNEDGYKRLIKIFTSAARDGFYYQPRTDYKTLKKYWSNKDLALAVPFYDSYIFNNSLYGSVCVPEFEFCSPTYFLEDNDLPFDKIIRDKVIYQSKNDKAEIQSVQSVYYKQKKDFKSYLTFRCINNRSSLDKPELEHMTSDEFCIESWREKSDNS
tara:strand:- start:2062 stop:2829 length:768 start_codon:yes stop_codon:yes gene_type:complete